MSSPSHVQAATDKCGEPTVCRGDKLRLREKERERERERERGRESEIIKAKLEMNAGACQSGADSSNYTHYPWA